MSDRIVKEALSRPSGLMGLSRRHFVQTCPNGFGDGNNSYAHSMAWFNGYVYVGTSRATMALIKGGMTDVRLDVWPVADYGVLKGFAKTFGKRKLPKPKQFAKIGDKWRPYRSVAAWYFWRALDAPDAVKKSRFD